MRIVGLTSRRHEGAVAVAAADRLLGACAEERVTRVRSDGSCGGWPDAAFALLRERHLSSGPVTRWVVADDAATEPLPPWIDGPVDRIATHLAHASTAYRTSPFDGAAIVICDHKAPEFSVWVGDGATIRPAAGAWVGSGFAAAHAAIADALDLGTAAPAQRLDALARLASGNDAAWATPLLQYGPSGVAIAPGLRDAVVASRAEDERAGRPAGAAAAAALLGRLGDLLVERLDDVRLRTGVSRLCVGGSLFRHSSMTTRARLSGHFDDVFVPIDPGDAGLAVGAALHGSGAAPAPVSPFLGPAYDAEAVKAVLANCKLQYAWESSERGVQAAVEALLAGHMVGWFEGAMEWGARALGGRSILASPFSPYVLENLNRFLKHREPWRAYALSGLAADVRAHFSGPDRSPYMECDYRPRDPERFRHVLPSPDGTLRVQTVGDDAPPRFRRLLEAFGEASGLPFLVNTSFNGFHEPIVCSPRDAVRVFYGSGLDLLVIEPFVLRK